MPPVSGVTPTRLLMLLVPVKAAMPPPLQTTTTVCVWQVRRRLLPVQGWTWARFVYSGACCYMYSYAADRSTRRIPETASLAPN